MASKKIQLYTDRANTIEASPETSANCVILSDGNDLQKVLDNDLTNPTVVHEETSFKVGVGDIDVSGSIVDGEVGRMVIKGKTYQNILPEPSTHVLTNNKEMFKVNEGLDPNVEIVDAVSKSAILKGQTLVNLLSTSTIKHEEKGTVNINYKIFPDKTKKKMLKIKFRTLPTLIDGANRFLKLEIYNNSVVKGYLEIPTSYMKLDVDYTFVIDIFDNDVNKTYLTSWIPQFSTGVLEYDVLLCDYQDGMENWDIPYFEGMQSVKMPVLTTTGKNLFDGGIERGAFNNGVPMPAEEGWQEYIRSKNFTKVNSLDFYTSINTGLVTNIDMVRIHCYDENYEYISTKAITEQKPTNTKYIKITAQTLNNPADLSLNYNIQIEEGSVATSYEPYKTNILHAPEEVVLRSLPNGVKDTLNLNTGEYVQRIGEIVLDGSETWNQEGQRYWTPLGGHIVGNTGKTDDNVLSNKYVFVPVGVSSGTDITIGQCRWGANQNFMVNQDNGSMGVASWKTYLSQNPLTIQCQLATPIIKTVDLSTSGNWEKVVLDGKSSENWQQNSHSGNFVQFEGYSNFCLYSMNLPVSNRGLLCDKLSYYGYDSKFRHTKVEGISDGGGYRLIFVRVKTEKLPTNDVAGFKQWLSQNPIEVSYMLSSHQDSTQVKQPIFFKDGHVQLSSGADNSLIPTLDYQAKTSNSYVMDLMKTNTKYTMKAKSASGTFTIDGTSYGAGTNGTFTTPSSMTNKLLVMSDTAHEEVMILEGDVTDKTIPYFKGIKSAFEDEDKIEVLSTSQNILDTSKIVQGDLLNSGVTAVTGGSADSYCYTEDFIPCPNIKHPLYVHRTIDGVYSSSTYYIFFFDEDKRLLQPRTVSNTFAIPDRAKYLRIMVHKGDIDVSRVGIMVTNSGTDRFNQSVGGLQNNTKIPLLSPLRSLPNGVCDELIIDRMKKKATLIQKVGYTELNGDNNEQWGVDVQKNGRSGFVTRKQYNQKVAGGQNAIVAEHLLAIDDTGRKYDLDYTITMGNIPSYPFVITIPSHIINERGDSFTTYDNAISKFKRWLSKAPISVVYQLATPVVTEIDLENFPLVYKDGHIFLNSEIAPVVEIDYNVNQAQQIQANNETLQRHELDILDLDNLIVSFVNAEYNLRLLKFDMELSMMALAE